MAVNTSLLALQYVYHGHTTFMAGNQFFDVAQHSHERRVLFLSHFFPKALACGRNVHTQSKSSDIVSHIRTVPTSLNFFPELTFVEVYC